MPAKKPVEERWQTHHKLETMDAYWSTWARIIIQYTGPGFCTRHLWLVDAMAGTGLHESRDSVEGAVPGTPLQAVRAARALQREFPGFVVHVRAIEIDSKLAADLENLVAPYVGEPPDGVDVTVTPRDWRDVRATIASEITESCGEAFHGRHSHRSLWLLDPFGLEPLDASAIDNLPPHAEVIVNFDENAARRNAGNEPHVFRTAYKGERWKQAIGRPTGAFADEFMDQFPLYEHRNKYGLRPTAEQHRYFIHLAHSSGAIKPFKGAVSAALRADTIAAGGRLTVKQKQAAAEGFAKGFGGLTTTIDELHALGVYSRLQVKAIVQLAHDERWGRWDPARQVMDWFVGRAPEETLWG